MNDYLKFLCKSWSGLKYDRVPAWNQNLGQYMVRSQALVWNIEQVVFLAIFSVPLHMLSIRNQMIVNTTKVHMCCVFIFALIEI